MQVRVAALKREEDALHREHDRLEQDKGRYIKCALECVSHAMLPDHMQSRALRALSEVGQACCVAGTMTATLSMHLWGLDGLTPCLHIRLLEAPQSRSAVQGYAAGRG